MSSIKTLLPALLLALATACASGPRSSFLDAHAAYRAAAEDPAIAANAPVELREARKALDEAEKAEDDGESDEQIDHLSYLAGRRVEIARAVAASKRAEQRSERLEEQKDQVVLDARKREIDALNAELAELKARETERGIVLTMSDVLFDVDQATLKPGAQSVITRLAAFLREHPDRSVQIEGHTDSTGTSDYNLQLSLARAENVARALTREGIEPTRVSARGFGEGAPVADNATPAGRLQNRRVELIVGGLPPRVGAAR